MESSDTERDQPRRGRESRPPKSGNDGFITPQELLTLMDTIAYFVHLKMHVLEQNADFTVPSDVDRIIELARGLPMPRPVEWGSLAMGRISTKRTFCADGTEEIKRARRRAWKTEYNQELIDLVENDKTTDGSNLDGSVNWPSIARKLGYSSPGAVQRQYELLMDKNVSTDWEDYAKSMDLLRLVQNPSYRERILGTQELEWDAVAAHLQVTEKSARDKYHEMTGSQ